MSLILNERLQCSNCPIRHRAICERCDDDELALLENIKNYKTYAANEPIVWRSDDLTHFSSIVSGVATLTKSLEDGRVQMVGLLLPSDFIGRPGRTVAEYDVTATTDVTLCRFQRKPFEKLVLNIPHVAQRMMEMALDELDAARDWMVLLGRKNAKEKIATFLIMLIQRAQHADYQDIKFELPLTREQIANFLGLTLETVSRQLSQLRKENIIDFPDRKHFLIKDLHALHIHSGDDADGGVIF